MKCPNCGKEIADDSLFCEWCGTKTSLGVKTTSIGNISKSKPQKDYVLYILLVIFLSASIIFAVSLYNKSEAYSSLFNKYNAIINPISTKYPLIILDVEIANTDKNNEIETKYGDKIYNKNTMYLTPRVIYVGLTSGSYSLDIKLYQPDGKLSTGESSPSGYSYSSTIYVTEKKDWNLLSGWGGDKKGHWSKGKYKIEIWYSSSILYSKEFIIY